MGYVVPMPRTNELCDHVVDLLSPLGKASYRFMFGGYGVYVDGLMIAIVAADRLLLRADAENRPDYEARGIGPFRPYQPPAGCRRSQERPARGGFARRVWGRLGGFAAK